MTQGGTDWDFFVSYTKVDQAWAEWIAWELEAAGYNILLQAWDFGTGSNWVGRIQDGVTHAARTIAVLSTDYLNSEYCQAEWQAAWHRNPNSSGRTLLPVRIEDCDRPGLLGSVVSVDLFETDEATARDRLRDAVQPVDIARTKPAESPVFPGGQTVPRQPFPGSSPAAAERGATEPPGAIPVRPPTRWSLVSQWFNSRPRAVIGILATVVLLVAAGSAIPFYLGGQELRPPNDVTLLTTPNELVSSNSQGVPADGNSGRPALDRSGRFVVFTSVASNLADNAGGHYNIYVKDRTTGTISLASPGADGGIPNGDSQFPTICPAGRWVAFASMATNLLGVKLSTASDIWRVYVYDTLAGTTQLVSVDRNGGDPGADSRDPQFSADCSRVVFESNAANLTADPAVPNQYDVYVRDLRTQSTLLASRPSGGGPANSDSTFGVISPDGKSVAFTSWATNLGIGYQGPEAPMIYVEDLASHQLESPSTALTGSGDSTLHGFGWPDYSSDGRYLVFRSITASKDPSKRGKYVFVWDLVNHQSALTGVDGHPIGWSDACVSGTSNGTSFSPKISDASSSHGYRVLFTVPGPQGSACRLIFRELDGPDIPVKPQQIGQEILEPALNDTGDVLAWAVAGTTQLVYACNVTHCS